MDAYSPNGGNRVRINISKTSTGKFSAEKTIEVMNLDLTLPEDRLHLEAALAAANDIIARDIQDLARKLAGTGDEWR